MKKILLTTALFTILFIGAANAKQAPAMFNHFYSSLSPYGAWIELDYGTLVWQPRVSGRYWAPYTRGGWIWSDYGWFWDSYEPFGYITYHYGRWYNDDYYGWIWIPDYDWAPSWVEWRYDDDYIGWAPLSPYASFSISLGIHFTHNYYVPYNHWNFVHYNNFCSANIYHHFVGSKYKYRIYNHSQYQTNYRYRDGRIYNDGVDFDRIRTRGNLNIERRQIERVNDPASLRDNRNSRDGKIRTYIADRDELSRNTIDRSKMDVRRDDRKSGIDFNRVEIGDRRERNEGNRERTRENNDVRNNEDVKRQQTQRENDNRKREEVKVQVTQKENDNRKREEVKVQVTQKENESRQREELQRQQQQRDNENRQREEVKRQEEQRQQQQNRQQQEVNRQREQKRETPNYESNSRRNIEEQNRRSGNTETRERRR